MNSQDAWELCTLRNVLEGLGARLAAVTITKDKVHILNAAVERLVVAARNGKRGELADADFSFHKTIIHLSGHQRLQQQYKIVEQQIRLYIVSCNTPIPNLDQIIVKAIISQDALVAQQLAKEHNLDGKGFVKHLQALERKN